MPSLVITGAGACGGSVRLTDAVADRDVSATLVARTVTVASFRKLAGAAYNPEAEIVPITGVIVHVTAVFGVPDTVAVNCCVRPANKDTAAGSTVTVTRFTSVTIACPIFDPSAPLMAATVIDADPVNAAGAVYKPVCVTVPMSGNIDHRTDVLAAFVTVAVNCCVSLGPSVTEPGVTRTEISLNSATKPSVAPGAFAASAPVDVVRSWESVDPATQIRPRPSFMIPKIASVPAPPYSVENWKKLPPELTRVTKPSNPPLGPDAGSGPSFANGKLGEFVCPATYADPVASTVIALA